MSRYEGRIAQHVLCAVLLSLSSTAVVSRDALKPGTHVVYKDGAGRDWCVTVAAVDIGVDARAWAWFTINDDARRTGHVPVADLGHACKARGMVDANVPKSVSLSEPASAPKSRTPRSVP
jgi:hypothetical protein